MRQSVVWSPTWPPLNSPSVISVGFLDYPISAFLSATLQLHAPLQP
jgi:hypothetical protein